MPRVFALSVFLLSSTVAAAQAEALKCSASDVVGSMQAFLRDKIDNPPLAAVSRLMNGAAADEALDKLRQHRFPQGSYDLQLSEFLGKNSDESERDCTAKLTISAPGMKDGEGRVGFKVFKTEDDKVLFAADDDAYVELLGALTAYDEANGVYAAIQAETDKENAGKSASTQLKVPAPSRSQPDDLSRYLAAHPHAFSTPSASPPEPLTNFGPRPSPKNGN